jgi:hypothetical protein
MKKKTTNAQRGQVAIFVALIFQILFVFFAMLVNVGLLVHHKINLQNSVDLAAYYGAMKQAEVLNAIGHINFQIRQSLKLMTFRYRQMGLFGDESFPGGLAAATDSDEGSNLLPNFCLLYEPFAHVSVNAGGRENYCRNAGSAGHQTINLPPPPNSLGHFFIGFNDSFRNAVITANENIMNDCKNKNGISLSMLLLFVRAYKIDVAQRKRLAIKLAQRISRGIDRMTDLDDEPVKDGVENTFRKNLTYANKENVKDFVAGSSLADSHCTITGDVNAPPRWLVERFFWPIYWSLVANCSVTTLDYFTRPMLDLNDIPADTRNAQFGGIIDELFPFIQEPDGNNSVTNFYKSTLGFEKNPWCMSYFSVRAATEPKIPFSPFGSVRLTAKAFAKPFGGTIGPWSRSNWTSGSNFSQGGNEVESVSPIRVLPGEQLGDPNDPREAIDFPRYVGDTVGTKSKLYQSQARQAFRTITRPNIQWWYHLFDPDNDLEAIGKQSDFLAFPRDGSADGMRMRELELESIAPDQFDLAYYSVEPDWHRNYYVRLKAQQNKFEFPVRADLGTRHLDESDPDWGPAAMTIKGQLKKVMGNHMMDFASKLTYVPDIFHEFLTSYKSQAPDNHVMDPGNFGKCSMEIDDNLPPERATTGNCLAGGRVGYSVKLIDGDFLKQPQSLGGRGSAAAVILNPPPDDF